MTSEQGPDQPGRIKDISVYRNSFIGMILLACVPFLIFASIPVYGWLTAIGLFVAWVLLLAQGTRWFLPRPTGVIGLGVVAVLIWAAAIAVARLT
jgi:hypothetical protein